LLERISLAGICRATEVSQDWLYLSIKDKYAQTPKKCSVRTKNKGKIAIQMDELWSFVGNKNHKKWVWIALDQKTREIVGLHRGDRSQPSAKALWDSLPAVYRPCAVCYTDFLDSYSCVLPQKRHRPVDKNSGKMNWIERFNCTLRQRVSRLVRKSWSFSKSISNHIGAIWYLVPNYHSSLNLL
jgi:IS1 family transposase